jgi:hypothetical protein
MRIKIFMLFLGVLALYSCNNYLDREPLSDLTPDQNLKTESQLAAYAINLYYMFPTHQNWTFGTFGIDANTDNQAGMTFDNRYVPGQWKVGQKGGEWDNLSATDSTFRDIRKCNYFFKIVLPRLKSGSISGDPVNINHYIGEIYFMRAWVYFKKLQSLGDFPIVTDVLTDNKQALIDASQRKPRTEVARFILADLDSAINLMKSSSPDGKNNRLSKVCAQLVKSRVALYEATWLKYFKGTAFVPNGPDWPGKTKAYNANYQFKSGSIDNEITYFLNEAVIASKTVADAVPLVSNNMVIQQNASDALNPYCDMFSAVDMSPYKEVLLWRRYDKGLGVTHNVPVYEDLGNAGIGLTRGMVDGFLMANGLPIYGTGSGYAGDDSITLVRKNRDGRLWLFLKEPKQINVLYNPAAGDHATPVEPYPQILQPSAEQRYTTGYTIRKGLNYDGAQCGNGQGYTGAIVFRAVEAYLNYMEAYYELNGSLDATAQSYWTSIRTRAGLDPDFNKTIAATDLSQEAKNDWGVYSAGQMVDKTLFNIRRERRCELMAEGLRYMDLLRWRAMDQLIATPYHIEGFKLWGPMQKWYKATDLKYGVDGSVVSDPARSPYLRPYEFVPTSLVYNGYTWCMAHYLNPIAAQHFLITSSDGSDVSSSPIYQNPGWPSEANKGALGY